MALVRANLKLPLDFLSTHTTTKGDEVIDMVERSIENYKKKRGQRTPSLPSFGH